MPTALQDVRLKEVSLVADPACPDAKIALFKRNDDMSNPNLTQEAQAAIDASVEKGVVATIKRLFGVAPETPEEKLAKAQARIVELEAAAKAAPATNGEVMKAEDIQKSIDAAVAKATEGLTKTVTDLTKALEGADAANKSLLETVNKQIEAAQDAALQARVDACTYVEKAKREATFKSAKALPAEHRETLLSALEAENRVNKSDPRLREIGHGGDAAGASGSALAQIAEIGKAVRETISKSGGESLTEAQAFVKALKANPELYHQHRAETAARRGDPRYA